MTALHYHSGPVLNEPKKLRICGQNKISAKGAPFFFCIALPLCFLSLSECVFLLYTSVIYCRAPVASGYFSFPGLFSS